MTVPFFVQKEQNLTFLLICDKITVADKIESTEIIYDN